MSEANVPFNPQDSFSASADSADSDWPAESTALKGGGLMPDPIVNPVSELKAESKAEREAEQKADLADTAEVFDISQIFDASDLEDLTFEAPQAANRSSITTWLQEPISEPQPPADLSASAEAKFAETPNLAELVNLIQELNQCNGLLMDRVSQLEDALEHSQTALQDEVGRAQGDSEQDWASVQEQVANLFNQLEFAHQTNQRQQILVETVTGQLESSQERVAELEREAALVQQRYNEQSQLLAKSEQTSRDLQSRLQRQQRYTLQFKAALEKSLEVPTPQYELGLSLEPAVIEAASEVLFLPKAKQIQPWSAHGHASQAQPLSKLPWMKFQNQPLAAGLTADSLSHPELSHPETNSPETNSPEQSTPEGNIPERTTRVAEPVLLPNHAATQLDLPSFGSPLSLTPDQISGISGLSDLADAEPDPALKQQLDAAVKPLADLLAEALLNEAQTHSEAAVQAAQPPANLAAEPAAEPATADERSADQLLAAVMADAEDALWQDLARLIDVSAEDVVKASLSGDLAAFETLDFTTLQAINEPQTGELTDRSLAPSSASDHLPLPTSSANLSAPIAPADPVSAAPLLRRLSQTQTANLAERTEQPDLDEAEVASLTTSSWPSPVVYPLRPVKKRQSLAMVDLPSFPKANQQVNQPSSPNPA